MEAKRQNYRLKKEDIPKKPFLIIKRSLEGRQDYCEATEFLIPKDNQAGPGGLFLTAPNRSLMR